MKTGTRWTEDEDKELLGFFRENKTTEEIGTYFKRSIGSVQNRVMTLMFQMINEDLSNIEQVCQEYNIDVKEMERYIGRREKRRDNRKEIRKNKNKKTDLNTQVSTNTTSETNSSEVVSLLREIRNYMKIIIDKLDK